jgi:hypothetical protein
MNVPEPVASKVIVKVIRSSYRAGYSLTHNQSNGFKGIIGNEWAWFKYKSDAEKSAEELMNCWNKD